MASQIWKNFYQFWIFPSVSINKFLNGQEKLTIVWEATTIKEMELAASEEKNLAI